MKKTIRVEGDIAYIPLSKGFEAIIDAADVPLVQDFNWCVVLRQRTAYARRCERVGRHSVNIRLHRVLTNAPNGVLVDHRDGDGLNNRRSNLRFATKSQNAHNMRKPCTNTSGHKGVTWDKRDHKWQAKIMVGGRQRSLGYFEHKADAARAYAEASAELHGEFGRID